MKRAGDLWEKIISVENIMQAHKNARKGKRRYRSVQRIDSRPYHYARNIRRMLKNRQWIPTAYTPMTLTERGKSREILKVNYYPDRIIHHAIMQVVQPILESTYIKDTYQSIKGRGLHAGVKRMQEFLSDETSTRYTLKMDIKKFYPSVKNEILKKLLRKKIKCKDTLYALDRLIDSTKGLPIGNYTSQTFGNFYLTFFDHFVKEELGVKRYIRYADDMVIMHSSKAELRKIKIAIERYLEMHLDLSLKGNWQIFPTRVRGVDFLGYRFFGNYTLVRKSIAVKFKRAARDSRLGGMKFISTIMSYLGWILWADGYNFLRKFAKPTFLKITKIAKMLKINNPVSGLVIAPNPRRMAIQGTLF